MSTTADMGASQAPSIDREVNTFIQHVDSLSYALPLVMLALDEQQEAISARFPDQQPPYRWQGSLDKLAVAFKTMPGIFFVSLISQYDVYLGRLIRAILLIKPELLTSSERSLTFSQLVGFDSVDDAREYIIEKEVESVLRQSHADRFKWMESKFNVPLRKGLKPWPSFVEITERRNLFVHTGGVVSSQYLRVCREHHVEFDSEPQVGTVLQISPQYIERAFDVVLEVGVKLAHVLWRKFQPGQRKEADENLYAISHELLNDQRYDLARELLDFATVTLKKHSSERMRRRLVINRAQAYKWSGDETTAREIVSGEDWTATEDKFRLAEAVLLGDYARAAKIMRSIGSQERELSMKIYRSWSLFKEFRETQEFLRAFEEIFGEPPDGSF